MRDEQLLKKLYELKTLNSKSPDKVPGFIDEWIADTQMDIAQSSKTVVGLGDAGKVFKKWIKHNQKALPDLAGMIKLEKSGYMYLRNELMVVTKTAMGLPVATPDEKRQIAPLLDMIISTKETCTEEVTMPTRAELDAIIKLWKAEPKSKRAPFPVYDFGKDKPRYNAELLMDMLAVFPSGTAFLGEGKTSSLLFKWESAVGMLLPISK